MHHTNILLFLAHLSKDPVVINELVTSSENLYSGHIPAELQTDISFLTDLVVQQEDTQGIRGIV